MALTLVFLPNGSSDEADAAREVLGLDEDSRAAFRNAKYFEEAERMVNNRVVTAVLVAEEAVRRDGEPWADIIGGAYSQLTESEARDHRKNPKVKPIEVETFSLGKAKAKPSKAAKTSTSRADELASMKKDELQAEYEKVLGEKPSSKLKVGELAGAIAEAEAGN